MQDNIRLSMSGKGNCYDNAAAERFYVTVKLEAIPEDIFRFTTRSTLGVIRLHGGVLQPATAALRHRLCPSGQPRRLSSRYSKNWG